MYPEFDELLLLFNLSLREQLLQGAFDTEWEAAVPGRTWLACFHGGCVWASIRCAAHTAQPDSALWQVWQTSQHCLSLSAERESVFSSLTTQMKEKLEETVILPPHTAFALHSNGVAELYKVSIFFLLWMW